LVHPFNVPVTVYVVVVPGVNAVPLIMPPDQLYDVPPVPLNVTDVPEQTVEDGDTVAPTAGITLMVILAVVELAQPPVP